MAEDRGGLQYSIKIGTEGLGDVQSLRAEIESLKASLDDLKKSRSSSQSGGADKATERDISSTKRSTRSLQEKLATLKALTRQEQAREAGLASLDAAARKQETTDARAIASQRAKFRVEQRSISNIEARRKAEERLTQTIDKRRVAEETLRQAPGRGVRTDEEIAARARAAVQIQKLDEQDSQNRIAALKQNIQERLNAQVQAEENLKNQTISAQEKAIQAERAIEEQKNRERISSLRKNIQDRGNEAVKAERDLADKITSAQERAAISSQKLQEEANSRRIDSLRQNIQDRLNAQVKAETETAKKVSEARERAAVENQKKEAAAEKARIANLQEGIKQREKDKVAAAKARVLQAQADKDERAARLQKLKDFFNLRNSLDRTDTAANRVSFTFRRLFGILAAFTAARLLAQQFTSAIKEMINFSRRIELAQLGVAALILATGQVANATGEVVDKTEQFVIAQREARKQLVLLRRDSLKTAATFQELLDAFQVGLAPGLQAGLNLDEIRKFSIRISQAATALGLSQNQLSEEIRSILSGTIQQRTTRIAASLGITNEDIKRAKEAGTLVEFLNEKFSAFKVAGEEAFNTFEGVLGRVRDGISLLLGAGGLEFFQSVKDLLKDIFESVAKADPISGVISPDPSAVRAVEQIGSALSAGIEDARAFAKEFGGLEGVATAVGAAVKFAFSSTKSFLIGFVQGFRLTVNLGKELIATLKKIPILSDIFKNVDLQNTILFLGQISALLVGISIVTAALKAPFAVISLSLGAIKILLGPINVGIAAIGVLWGSIAKSIALAKGAMLLFSGATLAANAPIAAILATVVATVAALAVAAKILNDTQKLNNETDSNKRLAEQFDRLQKVRREQLSFIKELKDSGKATESQIKSATDALASMDEELKQLNARALGNVGGGEGFLDPLTKELQTKTAEITQGIANSIKSLTSSLIPDVTSTTAESVQEAQKLSDIFKDLPGQVTRSRTELERQADTIKKLTEDTDTAEASLRDALETRKLSGNVEQQISAVLAAEVRIKKEGKALALEERDAAQQRLGVSAQQVILDARIARLSEDDQRRVKEGILLGKSVLQAQSRIANTSQNIAVLQERILTAREDEKGFQAEVIKANQNYLGSVKKTLETTLARADALTGERDNQGELNDIISRRLDLEGKEAVLRRQSKEIAKDQLELENRINNIRSLNIRKLAEVNQVALTQEATKIDAERAQRSAEIDAQHLRITEKRILLARVEADIAARDLTILQQQSSLQEKALASVRAQTQQALFKAIAERKSVTTKEDIERLDGEIRNHADALVALDTERAALEERNAQAIALQNINLQESNRLLQEARDSAEQPVKFGLTLGLREFATQAPDLFQSVFNAAKSGAEQFSQFLADSITSAFDPTQDTSIQERFGQLLLGVANQFLDQILQGMIANFLLSAGIIQAPLQLASSSLLVAAGPLAAAGSVLDAAATKLIVAAYLLSGTQLIGLGIAGGGNVGAAFRDARGYAGGGVPNRPAPRSVRPSGLDPRDTVAAWLDPKEWVIRGTSVARYGAAVMDKINRGLIDPLSLKALAGVAGGLSSVRSVARGSGMASGGSVSSIRPFRAGSRSPSPQVIVASEETFRRLVRGGSRAFREEAQRQGLRPD